MDAMPEIPLELATERDALIAEVYAAFADVSRKGAVSWSEARVIDRYGSDAARKEARRADREANWQGLVDAKDWPGNYGSEWSFLDALGFRYYLAPALVRLARTGDDCGVHFHLTITEVNGGWERRWLSSLDLRQKHCVRRVIEHVIAVERGGNDYGKSPFWREAYESYWSTVDDEEATTS